MSAEARIRRGGSKRMGLALAGLALLAGGCARRAAIPAPRMPLAATPADALAGPPAEAPADAPFAMRLERRTLDNGVSLLVSRGAPDGIVAVVFVSRATPRWDGRAHEIVTRLAARSMFRATEMEDGTIVDDAFEAEGFTPEVDVLPEGVRVSARVATERLPRYLELLSRALRLPVYRDDDLRVALAAAAERLEGHALSVDGILEDRLPQMLYASTDPRAMTAQAALDALVDVDAGALARRHAQLLDPSRCAVVVAGDVEPRAALATLGAHFGALSPASSPPVLAPPVLAHERGPRGLALVQPLIRAYVNLRERAPPLGHADHAAFRVLEQLLGGMFGARLNLVLREEHTVSYGFHASYSASAVDGELELTTAIDPPHTRSVVATMMAELSRMRGEVDQGIEPGELTLAKTRARELLLAELDTSLGMALVIARAVLAEQDPAGVEELLRSIDGLSADDVEAAARRWIRVDRAPIAVIAGESVVESLRSLGVGDWEVVQAPLRERRR